MKENKSLLSMLPSAFTVPSQTHRTQQLRGNGWEGGGDRGGSGDRVRTKVAALNPERIRVNDTGIS